MAKLSFTGSYLLMAKCIDFSSPHQNLPVTATLPLLCTHCSLGHPARSGVLTTYLTPSPCVSDLSASVIFSSSP